MAILASLAIMAITLLVLGADPVAATGSMLEGALGSSFGIGETLTITSILVLTGLAAAVPFAAGMWNIGGEGQMYAGAVAATAVAFTAEGLPAWAHVSLAVLAAVAGGALWGLIPGVLKTRLGANEVIVTLMLVYVAMYGVEFTINHLWPSRAQTTPPIPSSAALPTLVPGAHVSAGVLLALAAVVGAAILLRRTHLGFAIRATGDNVRAARLSAIRPDRVRVLAFVIGGGFAGAAGGIAVLGVSRALVSGFSDNFGFIGIAVALMARLSPVWIVGSALLFSVLRVGANQMQVSTGLDPSTGDVLVTAFVLTLMAFGVIRVKQLGSIRE
ncbi:MAG TPA: ABC transporter permease [Actinomycetes bacterium]|nr:ABC transporter permease [Actinomycetes bacterium]